MMGERSDSRFEISEPGHPHNTEHYRGAQRAVVFARLLVGDEPARQFYDQLGDDEKDAFDNLFVLMGDHGTLANKQKFRHKIGTIHCEEEGSQQEFVVSEFKIHKGPGYRIMAVLEGNVYVLTHGCPKPKDAQLPREVARARRVFCEDRLRRRS